MNSEHNIQLCIQCALKEGNCYYLLEFHALGDHQIYIYTIMYTMCPPGCYHKGFMATPETPKEWLLGCM